MTRWTLTTTAGLFLVVGATVPLAVHAVARSGIAPRTRLGPVLVAMAAGALLASVARIARGVWSGDGLRAHVWVREPQDTVLHRLPWSRDESWERLRTKLKELGFEHRPAGAPWSWVVFKGRSESPGPFLARPFLGFVRLEPDEKNEGLGSVVCVDLRLMETILFETGERTRIRRVAQELSLRGADPGRAPWSFGLACGFMLAAWTAFQSLVIGALPAWLATWTFSLSLGAVLYLVPGLISRLQQGEGRAAWVVAAIVAAAVPYLGWLGS